MKSRARSSILNSYDAVRQEADIAGGILGPDLIGVLSITDHAPTFHNLWAAVHAAVTERRGRRRASVGHRRRRWLRV